MGVLLVAPILVLAVIAAIALSVKWSLMRVLSVALILVLAVIAATALSVKWSMDVTAGGRSAVDQFHTRYDARDFVSIYGASHPTMRQALTRDDAVGRLGEVRAKLGSVFETSFACAAYLDSDGTATLRLEYLVTFANGEAWETYDWRYAADSEPQLLAYAVETGFEGAEGGTPDWEVALAPRGVRPNATTCAAGEQLQRHWWER